MERRHSPFFELRETPQYSPEHIQKEQLGKIGEIVKLKNLNAINRNIVCRVLFIVFCYCFVWGISEYYFNTKQFRYLNNDAEPNDF